MIGLFQTLKIHRNHCHLLEILCNDILVQFYLSSGYIAITAYDHGQSIYNHLHPTWHKLLYLSFYKLRGSDLDLKQA